MSKTAEDNVSYYKDQCNALSCYNAITLVADIINCTKFDLSDDMIVRSIKTSLNSDVSLLHNIRDRRPELFCDDDFLPLIGYASYVITCLDFLLACFLVAHEEEVGSRYRERINDFIMYTYEQWLVHQVVYKTSLRRFKFLHEMRVRRPSSGEVLVPKSRRPVHNTRKRRKRLAQYNNMTRIHSELPPCLCYQYNHLLATSEPEVRSALKDQPINDSFALYLAKLWQQIFPDVQWNLKNHSAALSIGHLFEILFPEESCKLDETCLWIGVSCSSEPHSPDNGVSV